MSPRRTRRRHPVPAVTAGLAVIAAMGLLALSEAVVTHAVVFVPLAAAAAVIAYVLGRVHGSRRPFRRDRARRLAESQRLGQLTELERLAGRPVDAMIASYRTIQGQYRRQP